MYTRFRVLYHYLFNSSGKLVNNCDSAKNEIILLANKMEPGIEHGNLETNEVYHNSLKGLVERVCR